MATNHPWRLEVTTGELSVCVGTNWQAIQTFLGQTKLSSFYILRVACAAIPLSRRAFKNSFSPLNEAKNWEEIAPYT